MRETSSKIGPPIQAQRAAEVSEKWLAVSGRRVPPGAVRALKQKKSGIYLLPGALPDGAAVIAKVGSDHRMRAELAFYAGLAPELPVRTLRLYGSIVEPSETWLFLENAGDEHYDGSPSHRDALTRWIVAVHLATGNSTNHGFEPVTARRYLTHLHRTRAAILAGLDNPALNSNQRDTLRRIDGVLAPIADKWQAIEACCDGTPQVLVHGDLVSKNIHVRREQGILEILPLDWEKAGWGVPATDLSMSSDPKLTTNLDIDAYFHHARVLYPALDARTLARLSSVGTLFRALAAMDWMSRRLAYEWLARPLSHLPHLAELAVAAVEHAGISPRRPRVT